MAGRGPMPKPADRRARGKRSDPSGLRVITATPTKQPGLPIFYITDPATGKRRRFAWPGHTRTWWRMWRDSPLASEFTDTDWSELLDTALLHARFWGGDLKLAGELRLRVAKFGATPEDRARLRITFAAADQAEEKSPPAGRAAPRRSSRYEGLKSVGGAGAVAGS